jgi:cell division protease FtsH
LLTAILKYKRQLKRVGAVLALAASITLVWFTVNSPERGRNVLATAMEKDSDLFFATERDITTLAQDAKSGSANSIGLSMQYALVSLQDGGRYYVRIDTQRGLIGELLKDKLVAGAPAVFALGDIQPPATPLRAFFYKLDSGYLSLLGPILILYLIWLMNPGRGAGNMFKTVAKPDTRFDDVVGVHDAKEALQDVVAYLKNPNKFSQLGAKPPRGVVLEGHFGSGKTLLARALAGEAGVPCFSLSGSDFGDMFIGVGIRRVKKLFSMAKRNSPCLVFIDEIDGLGKRSSGSSAGETENNRIINALLVELDGFSPTSGIVVVGATNNVANLDPALVRPGRFDRTCHLGLPNVHERESLYALYAAKLRTDGTADFRQLARLSIGLSPASIANIVNLAASLAAKEDASAVTQEHFQRILEQHRMGGPATAGRSTLSLAERHRIAVHEAGHAVVAKLLNVGVVEKVSILQRGSALGVTLVTSEQDAILQSEPEVRARMTMLLGGRSAEALVLKTASTGAANDLEHVSAMAYRMVTELGFSKDIGPFSYAGLPESERQAASYPEAIAEARQIIKEIDLECAALLAANRNALDRLTAHLLEHETVSGEVVDACLISGVLPDVTDSPKSRELLTQAL